MLRWRKTAVQAHYVEYLCLILYSHLPYTCNICKLHSPSFEHNNVVNITVLHGASLQELVQQGLEILVFKSCSQCKKGTEHIGSSNFLQPPQYLIIIVNGYGNYGTTKHKIKH